MKVTIFGTLPPLKGNAYYCWLASKALSEIITVEFISFSRLYPERFYPDGVSEFNSGFNIAPSEKLNIKRILVYYNPLTWFKAAFMASSEFVIIQWWSLPVGIVWIVVMSILRLRNKKIFVTVHNVLPHEKSFLYNFIFRIVCFLANSFFVHTKSNKKQLYDKFNIKENRINVVSMGVHDVYLGNGGLTRNQACTYLKLPIKRNNILLFGNLREYKGIRDALEAAIILKEKDFNFQLVIAGTKWTDWDNYERFIVENKILDYVKLYLEYIPMSDVKYFFIACDLVILPYRYFDAQSGVGNIALAFHKPLLVTKVGGLPDLVRDSNAVIDPFDPKGLACAIEKIIVDKNLKNKLINDAKDLSKYYSWQRFAEDTIAVLKQHSN